MTKKCFSLVSEFRAEATGCKTCEHFEECGRRVTNQIAEIRKTLPEEVKSFIEEHECVLAQFDVNLYHSELGQKIIKHLNAFRVEARDSLRERKNLVGAKSKPLSTVIDLLIHKPAVTNSMVFEALGDKHAASIVLMWLTRKKLIRLNGLVQELTV